jgi:hypothetical protein
MKVTSIKKIKYFFILSSVFLSLDTFSVDWLWIRYSEKTPQLVMSDLEQIVTDYMSKKHGATIDKVESVHKIHLWAHDQDLECEEINFSIDDIELTTQVDHAEFIILRLEDILASIAKGEMERFDKEKSNTRILKSSDGSKEYIKFGIDMLQLTATKEFFEKLLNKLKGLSQNTEKSVK